MRELLIKFSQCIIHIENYILHYVKLCLKLAKKLINIFEEINRRKREHAIKLLISLITLSYRKVLYFCAVCVSR